MSATDTNQDEGLTPTPDPDLEGTEAAVDADAPSRVQSNPLRLLAVIAAVVALGVFVSLPAVIVVLSLVFMIFMHELGHYLTARRAGMLVTEFFIGFGPRVWSFKRGEVEYGLKAIPAGAYVRIVGMTNMDEVDPADESRTYREKPYWQRFSVAVAGSTMHFLMALVLLFIVFVGFGEPNSSVWSIDQITPSDGLQQGDQPVESPAVAAGLRPGDRIVEVDGVPIREFGDLKAAIETRPGQTVGLVIERDGETIVASTTLLANGPDGQAEGFLGVSGRSPRQRLGVVAAAGRSVTEFGAITVQSVESLGRFFSPSGISSFVDQAMTANDAEEPAPAADAPASDADSNRIVSIYGAARIGAQATEAGMVSFLFFMALINIFIGVFNLVPLLPLDGGHVAIATYEKFREWRAGNRQRYFVDVARLLPVTYGVVLVLVSIGMLALYLDIANPINLPN